MPLYEFYCQDCKTRFETIVSSHSAIGTVVCKKCQGKNIIKEVSAPCCQTMSTASYTPASNTAGGCGCAAKSGFS